MVLWFKTLEIKRWGYLVLCLFFCLVGGTIHAADINKLCDVRGALNPDERNTNSVGFLLSIEIADLAGLKPDILIADPGNPGNKKAVFAILEQASWDGTYLGSIAFSGLLSLANQKAIHNALQKGLGQSEITFDFVVYDYDRGARQWYKSFHSNGVQLSARIDKQNDMLLLLAEEMPGIESPDHYPFHLSVIPKNNEIQEIFLAVNPESNFVKQWGKLEH